MPIAQLLFPLSHPNQPPGVSFRFPGLASLYRGCPLGSACLLIFFFLFGTHCQLNFADERLPNQPASTDDQIARYIKQLDDGRYTTRETASQQLAQFGQTAIRPLAIKAISGTPEAAWRAKQALEQIGTQGDEEVFYQAIGVLQLLYLDGSESLQPKIRELQHKWRVEQKRHTIKRLRSLGATIVDPSEEQVFAGNEFNNLQRQMEFNNMRIALQQQDAMFGVEPSQTTPASRQPRKQNNFAQLSVPEATREIDKILLATVEENRETVLGNSDQSSDLPLRANDLSGVDQVELQMRIIALRNRDAMNLGMRRPGTISVSLDQRWSGSSKDLKPLGTLIGLSHLELNRFNPGTEQLSELAKLKSVLSLKVVGSEISTTDLAPFVKLEHLNELEFVDRPIDLALIEQFADQATLGHVVFSNCRIEPLALNGLVGWPALRSVFFGEMQIDDSIFAAMKKLPRVNYLNLSVCKFSTVAYREFQNARRDINIEFTAQAFLGVRGPQDFNNLGGCEISQVVPDSGAAKAGMEVGDVIEEIDGQAIQHFEDLRLHIAQHKAGEVINVRVQRKGQPVELKIELTKFDQSIE